MNEVQQTNGKNCHSVVISSQCSRDGGNHASTIAMTWSILDPYRYPMQRGGKHPVQYRLRKSNKQVIIMTERTGRINCTGG